MNYQLLLLVIALVLALLASAAHHERANGLLAVAFALWILAQILTILEF